MSHEISYSFVDGMSSVVAVHTGVEQFRFDYDDSVKTITLRARAAVTRPADEFVRNVKAIQGWQQELVSHYAPSPVDFGGFPYSVSFSKTVTKAKYTGDVGAAGVNFDFKYATGEVTIGARVADEVLSWSEWVMHLKFLSEFAAVVADVLT